MTANVLQLLAVLAAGLGGVAALQAAVPRPDHLRRQRRSYHFGAHILRHDPHR